MPGQAPHILTTKLFVPPPRANLLPRARLLDKLNLVASYPLTLISASAGFGKTTLLGEWVAKSCRLAAWLSLDPGDNDPVSFLTYLIFALRTIEENFAEQVLEVLQSSQPEPVEAVLIELVNEVAEFPNHFVFILDDYHFIIDARTNELMVFLIDHLPPQMHLIVATRIDPPWPLSRYRVRNQLLEIRGQDLRFSAEEAGQFLTRTMELNLSFEDVQALEERTEGWIAGLQLAALSMQKRSDISRFVKTFTGSQLYIAEYLVEEILKQQPEDVMSFLLHTSILDRLQADLCEAVSGCKDGQAILSALHRGNLFVIPLDHEGLWFRYHHLFADLLQSKLPQVVPADVIRDLHKRASVWYEQNGFTIESVNHALAAKDFERVAVLIDLVAHTLIFTGRVNLLRNWLDALPQVSLQAHPLLIFYLFWIDVLQSKADLSEQAIQEKEEMLKALPSSPENDRLRGELMSVICRAIALSGRTGEGIRLAQEALAYLPLDDLASRARANSAMASALDLEGQAEEAKPVYQESYSQALTAGEYRLVANTMMVEGLIRYHYGHLHQAARIFQSIIDLERQADVTPPDRVGATSVKRVFFPAGQGYIGLGIVHLEWNDLDAAENYLKQGMELCRQGGLDGEFIGRTRMSRLRQAKGDLKGAVEELQLPEQLSNRVDDFNIATRQIEIALAREDVEDAWHWAAPLAGMLNSQTAPTRVPLLFIEAIQTVIARVYLAQGQIEKALGLLDRLQATAAPGKRTARMIEVYLLRAMAYYQQNKGNLTPIIIESIEHALELAEPEGCVLLFLEEGSAMIPLLKAVTDHQATPERVKQYARKLLSAFGGIVGHGSIQSESSASGLVEQLTPREMEVLALLAAGDSNQTIADKLVITVRTVKKHTSNIYGKLEANSRIQAVTRARQLGLLPAS